MHPRHGLGPAALALAAALAFPCACLAEGLSKDQVQKLEGGDVIMLQMQKEEGKGYIGGSSFGLLDESLDKCWNAIQDPRVYAIIYPTTIESKVVKQKGNKSVVKMVQGNKVLKATYYLNYTADPDKYKLSWKLSKSMPHDIADSRGYFLFSTYKDGRTLMKMSTILDLGNDMMEKLFGEKIAAGLLRLPKKFRKFLAKPEAAKYDTSDEEPAASQTTG